MTTTNALPDGWLRPLGTTGLSITAVTVGGSPLGGVEPRDEGIATARAALESPDRKSIV